MVFKACLRLITTAGKEGGRGGGKVCMCHAKRTFRSLCLAASQRLEQGETNKEGRERKNEQHTGKRREFLLQGCQ